MSVPPTPGPWRLKVRHTNGEIWAPGGPPFKHLASVYGDGCREVSEANGRLMAAAPELLETLEWLDRRGGLGLDVHKRIAAVIAKAGGRADVYA